MPVPRKKKRVPISHHSAPPPRLGAANVTVAAAAFKAQCLALMDRVNQTGEEIVVTKHNRPVAKLVPARGSTQPRPFFGRSQGRIRVVGDLVAPINSDWGVEEDL